MRTREQGRGGFGEGQGDPLPQEQEGRKITMLVPPGPCFLGGREKLEGGICFPGRGTFQEESEQPILPPSAARLLRLCPLARTFPTIYLYTQVPKMILV